MRTALKLKMILSIKIDLFDKSDFSAVYIFHLLGMGVRNYYVSMTQKKFSVRCREHIANVKHNRDNAALSSLKKKEISAHPIQ